MEILLESTARLQLLLKFWLFLFQLPTIIADNAGYDSADLVAQLRAAHTAGKSTYGLGNLMFYYPPYLSKKRMCAFK